VKLAERERPKLRRILSGPSAGVVTAAQGRLRALQRRAARQQGPWDPGAANPSWVNRVPPGAARWQDVEPPVRPSLHEQATQEAVKRQPGTGNRRARRGPPRRKARRPDE